MKIKSIMPRHKLLLSLRFRTDKPLLLPPRFRTDKLPGRGVLRLSSSISAVVGHLLKEVKKIVVNICVLHVNIL